VLLALIFAMPAALPALSQTQLSPVEIAAPPQSLTKQAAPKRQRGAAKRARVAVRSSPPGRGAAAAPSSAGLPHQVEPINAASETIATGARVNAVSFGRPGEALEVVPGLVVSQHSGEGKANQYFLRGFNLDHGTDLAIAVEGMPVNMRTHGHGQGYADVNFLIPELIQSVRIRKGPYFADEGDFSSAGAVHINYVDKLDPGLAQITLGSFGYRRGLVAKSSPAGAGTVLAAAEATTYDGPWDVPDKLRKFNGLLRYSAGTADNGFSVLGMAYQNRWTSTDQIAQRAIDDGVIGRYGTLDPTDGGRSSRVSLSGSMTRTDETSRSNLEIYAIHQTLTLFNNFTYFLNDAVNGDQFSQTDRRMVFGANASHMLKGHLGMLPTETTFGVQSRYDDISVGLVNTVQRATLSTVRQDSVTEGSVGLYASNTIKLTDWLRTVAGLRYDSYAARVASDTAANSGNVNAAITSPKFGVVFGPFAKTELFLNAGYGFHSNDARGATISVDPVDKVTPQEKVPLLVRARGAEIGVRTKVIAGLDSALTLFLLDYDSELLFVGDAGTTEASRPSRRIGLEWTNSYRINPWLAVEADLAVTRARFTDFDPLGDRIPGAPGMIVSASIVLGGSTGWFGALKMRHFGPRPLIEDDSVRSTPTTVFNARLGYRFENGVRLQLDALNLFNAQANQIEYYYESRLSLEPSGVAMADRHIHPVEPLAVRLTLAGPF
jgi:outer membrane receptor protein involved in Fe transport